jgi:peptidoglycan/xylan/chitin deacetylase (PgdA/CDA1 family)
MALIVAILTPFLLNYGIIEHFKTIDKTVAITFDACETKTPAYFDKDLLDFIIKEKLPATFFLSGKFIIRNKEEVKKISQYDFIEIESHSYSHSDFTKLTPEEIEYDIKSNEKLITEVTGKKPVIFRFPYGYYDEKSLNIVRSLNYKVVHWTFPSGDPDKKITAKDLKNNVLKNIRPGVILIFHINGRGWKTKEALPYIVKILKEKGYKFVLLKEVIK